MKVFQTSRVVAAVVLATGPFLPCISMADAGSARAPVWTEALGEVALDQYTLEERAQMIREYWTVERIHTAIPVNIALPENSVRALLESTNVLGVGDGPDAGSSPQQPYDPDFWTHERLCDALRNAIPVDWLSPDGSMRALLTGAEASSADRGSSPDQVHEAGYWTPERIRTAIPVKMFGPDADDTTHALQAAGADTSAIDGAVVLGESALPADGVAPEFPARACVVTPVDVPTADGSMRAWLVADDAARARDGGSSPDLPYEKGYWTPERIRTAIPVRMSIGPDGTVDSNLPL